MTREITADPTEMMRSHRHRGIQVLDGLFLLLVGLSLLSSLIICTCDDDNDDDDSVLNLRLLRSIVLVRLD